MIKRPFLWGITVFVGGILLAWFKIPQIFLILPALISWLLIYILMFRIKRFVNRKDYFLWGLPVLMFLGFLSMEDRMKPPDMDMAFDEKAECSLTGKVTMIVKKSWGTTYYLKDNIITLTDENTYLVEEIIVSEYTQGYQYNQFHLNNQNSNEKQKHSEIQKELSNKEVYKVGNLVTVLGTVHKFSTNTNPGGFNEHLYYKSQNISYKVNAEEMFVVDGAYSKFHYILNNIKDKLLQVYNTILSEKEAGTIIAMALGEKYLLGDEIKALYQENGISHILAISGLHISMVGAAIYLVLSKLRLGLLPSTLMSLILVYSYGIFTNFSVSTNRAVLMYSILLVARIIGKTFDILSALSLSAFLILLQNPMELFQAGFLLSFGAVLGIALFLPCLNNLYEARSSLLKGIYTSVSAQILTLPFILYYFFQLPVYSVFINLIILPLTSLLILSALVAGIVGMMSITLGVFLAGAANYILRFYELVCRLGSNLPGNLLTIGRPDNIKILIYFVLVSSFMITVRKFGRKRLLILLVIAIGVLIIPNPREGLSITVLDVGQGDGIVIETYSGTTYLIDGGSSDVNQVGRYRITPYLLSKGIDKLDYAIVTHSDSDHISGLFDLLEDKRIRINCLVLPDITEKNELYKKLEDLAKDMSIKLIYIVSGDMLIDGDVRMTFLHPPAGYMPASNNDYSTVLSISYKEFDVLLTGDLEDKGERELIDLLNKMPGTIQTDYDVLKVAHHGSKYSTGEEFLSIIKPELSLISCGKNNRYGHPHEELMERLDNVGSEVIITYKSGAITIKTDGKRMVVEEYIR